MEHVSRWRNGLAIACRHARSAPTFGEQVADDRPSRPCAPGPLPCRNNPRTRRHSLFPRDQPAPRTIEEFQRDRIRATVEAVLRRLNGIAGDLAEQRDLGAINEAMSDEKNGISCATALKLLLSSGRPWTRTR